VREPLVGSLCSGYGGLDLAVLEVLAGRIAWHCESDRAAARVLAEHWPDVPNHGDIRCQCPAAREHPDWRPGGPDGPGCRWAGVERVDVLAAGFPCQPWSGAGARLGTEDPRDLWPAVHHAVRVLRPRLVVLENVARFAGLAAGAGRTVGDLAALGYDARWLCLQASDVGAPHRRLRWFAVAWPAPDPDADRLPGRPQPHGAAL
jgi:DNA (cytosine-5)-methyltransferase 1